MSELGYPRDRACQNLHWGLGRLVLHRGDPDLNAITSEDLLELGAAVRAFGARDDFTELRQLLFGNVPGKVTPRAALGYVRGQLARLHAVHVLLFNTGQVSQPPLTGTQPAASWADDLMPEPCPAAIRQTAERYLRLRLDAAFDRPQTVRLARAALRRFAGWLTACHPEITSFADVTRTVIEEYLQWLSRPAQHPHRQAAGHQHHQARDQPHRRVLPRHRRLGLGRASPATRCSPGGIHPAPRNHCPGSCPAMNSTSSWRPSLPCPTRCSAPRC